MHSFTVFMRAGGLVQRYKSLFNG